MRWNRLIAGICLVAPPLGAVTAFLVSSGTPKHLRASVAYYTSTNDADMVRAEIATDVPLGEFIQIDVTKLKGPSRLHTVMACEAHGSKNRVRINLPTKTTRWRIIHKVPRPGVWGPISWVLSQGANHCAIKRVASLSETLWEKVRDRSGPTQIYLSDMFDVPKFELESTHSTGAN